ncbi:hypothetical protein V8G54_020369 [Vigna mungo]|uniref:Uncharacterized protein n=1 Tax=Vigna mungo TaxID=3915 RepID=A0AAQ3RVV1_VIGMU
MGKKISIQNIRGREGIKGHVDGTSPTSKANKELRTWDAEDARILSWILGSIEPHAVGNLGSFSTEKEIWKFLKLIYNDNNSVGHFQLELEVGNFIQGNLSLSTTIQVSEFCGLNILILTMQKYPRGHCQTVQEENKRDQFLIT